MGNFSDLVRASYIIHLVAYTWGLINIPFLTWGNFSHLVENILFSPSGIPSKGPFDQPPLCGWPWVKLPI